MEAKLTIAADISQAEWDILDEVATAEYDGSVTKALHKAIRLLKGHSVTFEPHNIPQPCILCGKPSTGAMHIIGDGEVGYACKEHVSILHRID